MMSIKKSFPTVATVSVVTLAGAGVTNAADTDSSSASLSSGSDTTARGATDTDNVLSSTTDGEFDWTQALVAAASITTIATGAYYSGLAVTALVSAGDSINQVVTATQNAISGSID